MILQSNGELMIISRCTIPTTPGGAFGVSLKYLNDIRSGMIKGKIGMKNMGDRKQQDVRRVTTL